MRNALVEAKNPDDIPKHNHKSITDLNNKAERDLYKLIGIIPSPTDDASRLEMLRIQFLRRMSQDNVRDIFSGINLCQQALNLELQTLTVCVLSIPEQRKQARVRRTDLFTASEWKEAGSTTSRPSGELGMLYSAKRTTSFQTDHSKWSKWSTTTHGTTVSTPLSAHSKRAPPHPRGGQ